MPYEPNLQRISQYRWDQYAARFGRYRAETTLGRRRSMPRQVDINSLTAEERELLTTRARPRSNRPVSRGSRAGRAFGVEIEFIGSRSEVLAQMRAVGLDCTSPYELHRRSRTWKVVQDGSVYGGGELVSPVLRGEDGRRQVELACQALHAAGATVNRTTGLHVHHDVGDLDSRAWGRMFRFWHRHQAHTNKLVARSREQNQFCAPLHATELERICSAPVRANMTQTERRGLRYHFGVSRYKTLNVQSYPRQGTVEIRQHQGTTDSAKILAWIEFGQAIIKWAQSDAALETVPHVSAMLDSLTAFGGLAPDTASFLRARAIQLHGQVAVAA